MQRSFTFVLLLVVIFVCLGPLAAQDAPTPEPKGNLPNAPQYALHGPYWVGVTQGTIDADSEHPIPITVWYPAQNPDGARESTTYQWIMKWAGLPEQDYPVKGAALRDAPPDASGAPYPLVIFSHGFAVSAATYAYLLEHLASYGFVVIAPEHTETYFENWADSLHEVSQSMLQRPRDLVRVLDYAETMTASGGAREGLIDPSQTAVVGHSAGADAAVQMAGGRLDTTAFTTICPTLDSSVFPDCAGILAELVRLEGLNAPPEGLWPSEQDQRVKAIIPLAGQGWSFGETGLNGVTVPMLAMAGSLDSLAPLATGMPLVYEGVTSPQKALAVFTAGEHFLYATRCRDAAWLADFDLTFICRDYSWESNFVHDVINHLTTAFLLATLKGDAEAAAALSPDAVSVPHLEYQTEGF